AGSEVNDSPFAPISKAARDLVEASGDDTPIEWIHRESRYGEKLATPDVTIADLIGDIDPIKAATLRLHYAHEGAIHYGIIPRTNRGVFVINELPDLQPRIQVGLFNILQEKDIQIRGFNVRIPLDVLMIFTANPEDYTNRGSIITPLKDRIESQILTHYPRTVEEGMTITAQEAWVHRDGREVVLPEYFKKIVEEITFQARASEFVDQKSGVSARLPISVTENLISNAERRAILLNDNSIVPRITDLTAILPGITGKIELVFEGEQEGTIKVAKALVGKAVREVFKEYFPDPLQKPRRNQRQGTATQQQSAPENEYAKIISWFESGNTITLEDTMPLDAYLKELDRVKGLRELTGKYMKTGNNKYEMASAMEFVLDALHQNSRIAKNELNGNGKIEYKDLIGSIFAPREEDEYEDN
ncbi:MAG TPA: sigma 54-interacting transcriptional regulator, partial [Candidatus Kapabacteria bacterium]|nr:sigma 54-interacting transcriptional regulator [Candidatus Kapabacteria bacterium]